MNKNQILLAALLTAALKNENIENLDLAEADWTGIYEEASAHEVHTLIYPLIKNLNLETLSSKALMSKWEKEVLFTGITQIQHIEQTGCLFEEFNTAGIPFIALKGLVVRELYPNPELRIMGDADILVERNHIKNAENILSKLEYMKFSEDSKHLHFIHKNHLCVEIHYRLISKGCFKKDIDEFEGRVWRYAKRTKICLKPALTLSLEDQIIHLCLHMAVHLYSSGFGLRQLCDFFVMTESKGEEIDWNEVFRKTNEYGITLFTSALFIICKKLFNTDIPVSYQSIAIDETYIDYLIDDIFSGGTFGRKSFVRKIINLQKNYINDTRSKDSNKSILSLLAKLFPSSKKLGDNYSYAKKYPILTPAAWIHRILIGIFRNDFNLLEKKSFLMPDVMISSALSNRIKLLHWLDLK